MSSKRKLVAFTVIATAAFVGLIGSGAHAGNALCPQVCLTGGVLSGGASGSSAAASSRVNLPGRGAIRAMSGNYARSYHYDWTAIDATGLDGVSSLAIDITVAGKDSASGFSGTGHAHLSKPDGNMVSVPVSLTDNGTTVSASGGGFSLNALSTGGFGAATYETSTDPSWDSPPSDGCDGHDNNNGLGHLIGGGQGHDCD